MSFVLKMQMGMKDEEIFIHAQKDQNSFKYETTNIGVGQKKLVMMKL